MLHYDAVFTEPNQRLPDGNPADIEFPGDLAFVESCAGRVTAAQNVVALPVVNVIDDCGRGLHDLRTGQGGLDHDISTPGYFMHLPGIVIDNALDEEYFEAVGFPSPGIRGCVNVTCRL